MLKIGVVGHYTTNRTEASATLAHAILQVVRERAGAQEVAIVSGLTNLGIPGLAYNIARKESYITIGVACTKALNLSCYPVDIRCIVGTNWGDESATFLSVIDVLIRVGGRTPAQIEVDRARERGIPVYEFDLSDSPVAV